MNVMLYSCPRCYAEFELADDDASACPECGHGAANDVGALRRPEAAGSTATPARALTELVAASERFQSVHEWEKCSPSQYRELYEALVRATRAGREALR